MATIRFTDAAKHFKALSHQIAAWNWLESQLKPAQIEEFAELYRADPPAKEPLLQSQLASRNPLRVPYYSQRDSAVAGQAMRMCFSSSCAMLVSYLNPGVLEGANGDDQYLRRVQQFGDSTDAGAQIKALATFGIKASFRQNGDWRLLEQQIDRGVPVPIGVLHHGSVNAPTGGGHWMLVIGYTPTHVIVNDPFGEMDLVNGGYPNTKGAGVAYSRKNLGSRWMVEGNGTGWHILATP